MESIEMGYDVDIYIECPECGKGFTQTIRIEPTNCCSC